MFSLKGGIYKDTPFTFSFKMHFAFEGAWFQSQGEAVWLAQSLPVPEPAPTSLEQKGSESGLGVRWGWLSKLRNVLVITFYCCVHLTFQIHPSWLN